jgi:hypothetical protein
MTKIARRVDYVADQLFQHFGFREALPFLPVPNDLITNRNGENASGSGNQRHFAQIIAKCLQKLLRHPSGAQQPLALGAKSDGYARLHCLSGDDPQRRAVITGCKLRLRTHAVERGARHAVFHFIEAVDEQVKVNRAMAGKGNIKTVHRTAAIQKIADDFVELFASVEPFSHDDCILPQIPEKIVRLNGKQAIKKPHRF